ncbi:MAG: Methyltransferase type 12 [Candidatus Sulfotelmatobacter sp.]|nr:Methyltransferase type 12 [Candidatus Sulfotelmatobacter sp.]
MFVAEVYRRMALRMGSTEREPPTRKRIEEVADEYRRFLPAKKDAAILDIGFGNGWFMAACLHLGYTNVSGAEFAPENKPYLKEWNVKLHKIESEIGEFLAKHPGEYDFIHMSHVIEHIPKYSLLWIVDAIYQALRKQGTLFLRTPNMEGPSANSSYYVTLAHEYGFSGSNLKSLLSVCGFDDICLHSPPSPKPLRQRLGALVRWPYIQESRIRHRLFGVNFGGHFGSELIATARRGDFPPLFDTKYR